jgi:hypothetical protein
MAIGGKLDTQNTEMQGQILSYLFREMPIFSQG